MLLRRIAYVASLVILSAALSTVSYATKTVKTTTVKPTSKTVSGTLIATYFTPVNSAIECNGEPNCASKGSILTDKQCSKKEAAKGCVAKEIALTGSIKYSYNLGDENKAFVYVYPDPFQPSIRNYCVFEISYTQGSVQITGTSEAPGYSCSATPNSGAGSSLKTEIKVTRTAKK